MLLSAALVACGQGGQVEVTAPAAAATPQPAAMSTFQGPVAAVDPIAGTLVVAVAMVWAPVMEARAHERRVFVDRRTQWEPGPGDLSRLLVGDEVQVEAEDVLDGTWRAVKVLLLDID
ncbi:MAG: DUF5666 domain-containing protein [Acidimicrobiales bacterium]